MGVLALSYEPGTPVHVCEVSLYRGISLIRNSPTPRTLQKACAKGPTEGGGGVVLMSEVPLYT
jgi:hypothetical protein